MQFQVHERSLSGPMGFNDMDAVDCMPCDVKEIF